MTERRNPAAAETGADPAENAALILEAVAADRLPRPAARPRPAHSRPAYFWAGAILAAALLAVFLLLPPVEEQVTARGEILKIEEALDTLAFPPGPVDGIADAATALAIREFQRAAGLPEDGRATPELLRELSALQRGE